MTSLLVGVLLISVLAWIVYKTFQDNTPKDENVGGGGSGSDENSRPAPTDFKK
jgi:hypothetical protein